MMNFDGKNVQEGVLGVPSHQKWIQEGPRHPKRGTRGPQDAPKEVKRGPQMDPRGSQGRQIGASGTILGEKSSPKR